MNQDQLDILLEAADFKRKKNEEVKCEDWNAWRKENPDEQIDFQGANLSGRDFSNAEFDGANFTRCNLAGVRFYQTNLKDANFTQAHLQFADMSSANLEGTNFDGAYLIGVNFTGATGLTAEQLSKCKDLQQTEGLPAELLSQIKEQNPAVMGA